MFTYEDLKWNERYAWPWYNSDAVFEWTDEDFDRRARELHDREITTIIIYTSTHFRFSFVPWWKDIIRCLERIVESCHRYGIKVIEHASTHLTFDPENEEDWKTIDNRFALFGEKSIHEFPDLKAFMKQDPMLDGTRLSSWRQINGRTGEWQRSPYCGYGLCFNNPNYRHVYFKHLRDIFATGIDGIMNDDIQYYGEACTCEHCRKLFKEKTGYDLPKPEQWDAFYGDYDNPVFVAFLKFKEESTTRFYEDIVKLETECGVHMLRPNYMSHILLGNWSAMPFESVSRHFSNIFLENIHASIIRYSFPAFTTEALHRSALARKHEVPTMSLFYPMREDDIYFSWALAHVWGHQFTISGLRNQLDLTSMEKKYRIFEKEHEKLYWNPKRVTDLAIYMSTKTRDYAAHKQWEIRPWQVWSQAACFSGMQVDMVFDNDELKDLSKHPLIVLPCIKMMANEELERLESYTKNGGHLLVVGDCGVLDENGFNRSFEDVKAFLGTKNVTYLSWEHNAQLFHNEIGKNAPNEQVVYTNNPILEQRCTIGKMLEDALPTKKRVMISKEYLSGLYSKDGGYTLHLMTIRDILPEKTCKVSYADIIPGYAAGDLVEEEVLVSCYIPDKVESITLYSPTNEVGLPVAFSQTDEGVEFTIPAKSFGGYAVLEINT